MARKWKLLISGGLCRFWTIFWPAKGNFSMLICPWSIVQQNISFWIWQLAKFLTQRLCDYLGFGLSTIRWNAIWTSASPYSGYKRNEFYDSRCPHAEAGCCWKGTNHSFYIEGEFLIFVRWKRERTRGDKGQDDVQEPTGLTLIFDDSEDKEEWHTWRLYASQGDWD